MALQGESLPPSAVWYLLFLLPRPPFSLSSFLVFARQSIIALSPFIVRYLEAPDAGRTKASLRLIWFLFSRCYFFQSSRSQIECAAMQISRHHTNGDIQIHTCARCVWKGFFNGIWRFQFPLCHQRQKTLWAQLPLSHTHPDRTTHTHTHTLTCNHRNTHIHAHLKLLWHSGESHNQSHASELWGVFVKGRFHVIGANSAREEGKNWADRWEVECEGEVRTRWKSEDGQIEDGKMGGVALSEMRREIWEAALQMWWRYKSWLEREVRARPPFTPSTLPETLLNSTISWTPSGYK